MPVRVCVCVCVDSQAEPNVDVYVMKTSSYIGLAHHRQNFQSAVYIRHLYNVLTKVQMWVWNGMDHRITS